jgi:hypothetical protein
MYAARAHGLPKQGVETATDDRANMQPRDRSINSASEMRLPPAAAALATSMPMSSVVGSNWHRRSSELGT